MASKPQTTGQAISITGRIYQGLYELQSKGREPKAIYLGHALKMELEECLYHQNMYLVGGKKLEAEVDKFCGVPVFCLVGHDKHFNIVSEAPDV